MTFTFTVDPAPSEISVRVCQCTFCRKHGARWTASPNGALAIAVVDRALLATYRFGFENGDFHVCTRCGVAPFVTTDKLGSELCAVVSVNAFEDLGDVPLRVADVDFDGEDEATRLARWTKNWIPDVRFV